jgi:putative glycosyltransferase (TIGR04348 family)
MKVTIVTPAPPRSRHGNRGTALRWAGVLRELGHTPSIRQQFRAGSPDMLVALHARRSAPSIQRFHQRHPRRPLIVALTGTDLYGDIPAGDADALQSLELATRLIVLHELPRDALPQQVMEKVRVIYQSAICPPRRMQPRGDSFDVCVVGHLRPVKDPFRTAEAVATLPGSSRIKVIHLGAAMADGMGEEAQHHEATNPRYRWLGDLPRGATLRQMQGCRLMVVSSVMEGGPTVLTEALAMQLPVLLTRIAGHVGMIGAEYPGFFNVGDTEALKELLLRAEQDPAFYQSLVEGVRAKASIADPRRELQSWRRLLDEVA